MANSNQLYAQLASYYDHFCHHIDYDEQSAFIQRAMQCFMLSGGAQYLDLACGSGQLLALMHARGHTVSGLDNSKEMLSQAHQRCPEADLKLCDLAQFQFPTSFDVITCLLYSMHYSHPLKNMFSAMECAFQALKSGGIYLFDLVDKKGIANDNGIMNRLDIGSELLSFQSRWWYRGEGDVLDLYLSIIREAKGQTDRWDDHHLMTAVSIPVVVEQLKSIGFEVFVLERDFSSLREWNGLSDNVLVVARKP
ncbi:methyltransferase type 11 [Oleiphilus messinensis]|uniref:Methyltransferase type 11 n=2 Tax=Oleiphilus messinensis TaxID=141451 RepID=A0A1Y0I260_9GAMM|nr:methyltransferase type 11 [Oleiphilus messinensis]